MNQEQGDVYKIGRGMADCTGPVADITMMGYATASQNTGGIHTRLYCRAFILADQNNSRPIVIVSMEVALVSQLVKIKVVETLRRVYGGVYTDENVLLTSTHTHSGPGGYMQYKAFHHNSNGFYKPTVNAQVNGVLESIYAAHSSIVDGYIYHGRATLLDASINRSPVAYMENPQWERSRYDRDVDTTMTLLKLTDTMGTALGMINWFSVHATSMNNGNHLISSDNKGIAALLAEQHYSTHQHLPGQGSFVAGFLQGALGDVSPNTDGPTCNNNVNDTCDIITNTCSDGEACSASGPGSDMFESTYIVGEKQFITAKSIFDSASHKLSGPIDYRLQYVNISALACRPALGYSSAAGTMDGVGDVANFHQGDIHGSGTFRFVTTLLNGREVSDDFTQCQSPKPILVALGQMNRRFLKWYPEILDFQAIKIGQFYTVTVPGEPTTMAGRRIQASIKNTLSELGIRDDDVVITALANSYAHYVTTPQEYQIQRYEGASTMYGPNTLTVIQKLLQNITEHLALGLPVDLGIPPQNQENQQISYLYASPAYDCWFSYCNSIGVTTDVNAAYLPGDTATIVFKGSNPRNADNKNARLFRGTDTIPTTFLEVQELADGDTWKTILTDSNWETKFSYTSGRVVTLNWSIPANQRTGTYKFIHRGMQKVLYWFNTYFKSYTLESRTFYVTRKLWPSTFSETE